jgi:manganese transport system substrate-binding protein
MKQRSTFKIQYQNKWTVILAIFLGLWLNSCSSKDNNVEPSPNQSISNKTEIGEPNKPVILTTFTVIADITKNVAGDRAIVESITKLGAEIHGYEPTPSDLVRGQKANLILDNGLNLELWATRFYNSVPKVPHITVSEGVETVDITEDNYRGKPNPHAWMSPKNALIYVDNIRKALVNLDPSNADTYNANAKTYSQKIQAIDKKLRQAIAEIPPNKRFIVSCEGAFSYLARDYDLKEIYLWAVNAERQATPKQIEKAINQVRENQIPAVFCESTVSNESQLQVARETGAKFAGVFYVDSLSPPNGEASTYLQLLEHNVTTLIKGLRGTSNK